MQKKWYAVYTRLNCEKKVTLLFTKKKIENFCPMNSIKIKSLRRNKILQEPLFKSYIFVNIAEEDICLVKETYGVINLLHWMGIPAIIREEEILAIKEFSGMHQDINLERIQVRNNDLNYLEDIPDYTISMEGKVFTIKNKLVKVNLPSLGYIMVARMQDESIFSREKQNSGTLRFQIHN